MGPGLATAERPSSVIHAEPGPALVRSPSDVVRLVLALVLVAVGLVVATAGQGTLRGFEADLLAFVSGLPAGLTDFLVGIVQFVATLVPLAVVVVLVVRGRWRLLGRAVLAGLAANLLTQVVAALLEGVRPPELIDELEQAWLGGSAYPDSPYLAAAVAVLGVCTPWLTRRWRRLLWTAIAVVTVLRVVSGTGVPLDLVLAFGIGWGVGALVNLAFGTPNPAPAPLAIETALREIGLPPVHGVRADLESRGSTPYLVTTEAGDRLFVKVLGAEERTADLLYRLYRWLRMRNVGDERPFSSLKRTVEHEALVSLKARDVGVRTPRMVNLATVEPGGMLIAFEEVPGPSLDRLPPDRITDALLREVWGQVRTLHRHRIAHRDLHLGSVLAPLTGPPALVDFSFSELAAADGVLASDVAELLCATTLVVGPQRAVAAAVDVLGRDAVAAAAPRLQPNAVSARTRAAMSARPEGFHDLRAEVQRACGLEKVELEELTRLPPRTIVKWLAVALAAYFLIPQLADVDDLWAQVQDAAWIWVVPVMVATGLTFVGAALAIAGSVPDRLPPLTTLEAQVASSFVSRITPASVGGMALNVRYLQKTGVEPAVAVAGVGINALAGIAVHLSFTLLFVLWAGRQGGIGLGLPSTALILGVVVLLLAVAGLLVALPWSRRRLWPALARSSRDALRGAGDLARQPGKLVLLFGGSVLVTSSNIAALVLALQAFGADTSVAAAGAVYLAGMAVASAAPVPGGIGAMEAALISGLTAVGVPGEIAIPGVFLYRLVTFWLPILPGWLAFTRLQRADAI